MAESNRLHSINTSRILRTIWLNPGISRIKAAEMLDLDRSTVTKILQVVLARSLVVTAGKNTEQSGVGRRQINLRINEEVGLALGIEMQSRRYVAVFTTIAGTVVHSFDGTYVSTRENLCSQIRAIIDKAKAYLKREKMFLLGIGIGFPGILDPYTGTIIRSGSFQINTPFAIRDEIEKYCEAPVFIENDANCCCWGELAFKTENRNRNFITVLGEIRENIPNSAEYHGLAIGLGLVIRGRVLHGDHFTAGEFRSIFADPQTGQFRIPYGDLYSLPEDSQLLDRAYSELAANLALLVNCVDFTKIVFSGDLPQHPGNLEELTRKALEKNWMYDFERNMTICFSENGKNSVAIGAAGLFIEKLFSVPDVADRFRELVGFDLYELILKRKGM